MKLPTKSFDMNTICIDYEAQEKRFYKLNDKFKMKNHYNIVDINGNKYTPTMMKYRFMFYIKENKDIDDIIKVYLFWNHLRKKETYS